MTRLTMLAAILTMAALGTTPASAVDAAHADVTRVSVVSRQYVRYLSLYHVEDPKLLAEWTKALNFWANSLSRTGQIYPLTQVTSSLWRLDVRDYEMPAKVWDKLADVDPYFHTKLKDAKTAIIGVDWPGGIWSGDGKYYERGAFQIQKEVKNDSATALAPWLNATAVGQLAELTQTPVPVVRADWWLVQTSQAVDRKGTGYYDFLQVKNRNDFQKVVGLDQAAAERLQKEVRAIVNKSGVALNNRQVIRFQTITGAYWVTLDSNKSTNGNNAVRNLNGDYKHDAEEIYGTLPNGLLAFHLNDAAGVQQNSAPDTIASDGTAPGNDRRVHAGISCVRCHVEGIRPIDDWGRRVYRSPLALVSPDYDKAKRLQRLYLSDLGRFVRRDQNDYAETLLALTGLKPAEMAKSFARLHASYQEKDLTLDQVAKEAGYTKAQVLGALKKYAATSGPLDPVLAGMIQVPDEPIRREHYEEVYSLLQSVMRGYKP